MGETDNNHPLEQFSVLIVDDSLLILTLLEDVLASEQFSLSMVNNAEDALGQIKAGKKVDLLISDYQLPEEMNGITLGLQAKEVLPEIKTIIITGYDIDTVRNENSGDYIILEKPFDPFKLKAIVENLVGENHPNLVTI